MFEKEAEEWVKENMDCVKTDNMLNEEIPYYSDEERCCARSAYIDGAEYGYNKANEWHYVADGDLPKKHGWYFVQYHNETFDCAIITKSLRFINYYTNKDVTDGVYAWKEIVPPKETENDI